MSRTKSVTVTNRGGIGFVGLLTILFIALKLTHVIAWPWVWVLSPVWIGLLLWLAVVVIALLALIIVKAAFAPKRSAVRHWNGKVTR